MEPSRSDPAHAQIREAKQAAVASTAFADMSRAEEPVPVARVHTLWRAVDRDLSPVIGRRGMTAVLRRALFTARRTHPWLPAPPEDAGLDACIESLARAFSDQCAHEADEADAATHLLEAAFREQLASLVGAKLTARLLRTAWSVHPARHAE